MGLPCSQYDLQWVLILIRTTFRRAINLIVYIGDVHHEVDIITEVIRHDSAKDVLRDVVPGHKRFSVARVFRRDRAYLAWPICAASYTVGPQLYHLTRLPSLGMNSFWRVAGGHYHTLYI